MNATTILTLCLIIIFFAVMMTIGIRTRKHARDVAGFVLGSRSVGPWLSAFAFGTSYFSAVIFVGYAGQFGWNFGMASTWIGLGNAFIGSLLAWLILGRRTRIMTNHLDSRTMPDFFGSRFGSKKLRVTASVITFIFLIPYTASLYNGLSRLFAIAFPGIDYAVCVVVMAALTCCYVVLGGYMATATNDFIQGCIMLIGIAAVIIAVLHDNGGLNAAMETLATGENGGWQYASFLGADPVSLFFVIMLTSLGTWGLPQMVGKFYAITNEDAIKKGTVISTFFALIVAGGCYFLGGFGRLYDIDVEVEGFDAIIPSMLSTLPAIIIGIIIVLVLSASMSTLSSLVLTSSSTITLDFIAPLSKRPIKETTKVVIMRVFIAVFVIISAYIAIRQAHAKSLFIAQMMGISWGALAGAFLAPFLYGLYWRGASAAAVWCSFIFSTVVMLANMFARSSFPAMLQSPINAGAFCMIAGLIIVPVVSVFTPKPDKAVVEGSFACYEEKVLVRQRSALADEQ